MDKKEQAITKIIVLFELVIVAFLLLVIIWLLPSPQRVKAEKEQSTLLETYQIYCNDEKLLENDISLKEGESKSLTVKNSVDREMNISLSSSDSNIVEAEGSSLNAIAQGITEVNVTIYNVNASGKTESLVIPVAVSKRAGGTKNNPLDASMPVTTDIYRLGDYIGRYTIQLMTYEEGDEAWETVHQNKKNIKPADGQEYVYMKFIIKNEHGNTTAEGTDIINFFTNLYEIDFSKKLKNIGWGTNYNNSPCISGAKIEPGDSLTCDIAILVEKSRKGIGYRLETGKREDGSADYLYCVAKP